MKTIWNLPKIEFLPFSEIHEKRRMALVTSPPAWEAVQGHLSNLPPSSIAFVHEATLVHWNKLATGLLASGPEVVYAIGGGLTADAGKFIADSLPPAAGLSAHRPVGGCLLHRRSGYPSGRLRALRGHPSVGKK